MEKAETNPPYYTAYEHRYQKVYAAGAARWGHSPDDPELVARLEKWVDDNHLRGKHILEFACGEGACGVILSRLGCHYHGVDIAPSAVEKARAAVADFPDASVSRLDMVAARPVGCYDAALDVMGLHMLVTDSDRNCYLRHLNESLTDGAPVLFYRESYREDAYEGVVSSFEEWKRISGSDYETPEERTVMGSDTTVWLPLVPARARSKDGYIRELTEAGFAVDAFLPCDMNNMCLYSVAIDGHKEK